MRDDNVLAYQRGLSAFFRGEDSEDAIAAGCNVAEVLRLLYQVMTKE